MAEDRRPARTLLVTEPASHDLADIRRYTRERHGPRAAAAYDTVLKQALRDIRDDPYRLGSKERPKIGVAIRSYHTALSRKRAGSAVRSPRHFVLYFLPTESEVVVSRLLHDSRDLARHIPEDHIDTARSRDR